MKFELIFLFLLISFVNSSKLLQSACKIVNEVHEKENWMKTVAIVRFKNNFESDLVDNLIKCLSVDVAVVLIDVDSFDIKSSRRFNPSFVVMIIDEAEELIYSNWFPLIADNYQVPHIRHHTRILVLSTSQSASFYSTVNRLLNFDSVTNFAMLSELPKGVLVLTNNDKVPYHAFDRIEGNLIEKIYPDNLKHLKGQTHNIFAYQQPPRVTLVKGIIYSKLTHYLDTMKEIEGSEVKFVGQKSSNYLEIRENLKNLLMKRQIHITLNTLIKSNDFSPRLMTYEETGTCALVPMANSNVMDNLIFFKPFDLLTWLSLASIIAICMILWRLSGHSSMWYIPFFFWAFYHGQSINFATNRKIFVILLQISVFMLLILGNAYQGLITSFMIANQDTPRLDSFDELLASDIKVIVSESFDLIMANDNEYQAAVLQGRVIKSKATITYEDLPQLYENNHALVMDCEMAENALKTRFAVNFYVIKEKLFKYYVQLQASHTNRYLRRWQLVMDWCFESGLNQQWERFESNDLIKVDEENRDDILRLRDMSAIFYVLMFGCGLSGFVLVLEILWHRFGEKPRRNLRIRRNKVNPFVTGLSTIEEEDEESEEVN